MRTAYLLYIAAVLLLVACKDERSERETKSLAAIKTYFDIHLPKQFEDYKSLDSLLLLEMDSVTHKKELGIPIRMAGQRGSYYENRTKLQIDLAKAKRDIAVLGSGLYGGSYVNEMQRDDAKEAIAKAEQMRDSAFYFYGLADSLSKVQLSADSTAFKYYMVKVLYQISSRDNTIQRDTAYVPVTKDFKILPYEQIARQYIVGF